MRILSWLGVILIVAWLALWLGLKLTSGAIHVLLVVGVILLIVGLVAGHSARGS